MDVLIAISEGKWYWPALGAVPGALRRKYPRAAIDVVASTRQAQLFAALPEVRQVTQTRPEEEYDLEISLGDRVEQRYSNEMLADDAARARVRARYPFPAVGHILNWIGDNLALPLGQRGARLAVPSAGVEWVRQLRQPYMTLAPRPGWAQECEQVDPDSEVEVGWPRRNWEELVADLCSCGFIVYQLDENEAEPIEGAIPMGQRCGFGELHKDA